MMTKHMLAVPFIPGLTIKERPKERRFSQKVEDGVATFVKNTHSVVCATEMLRIDTQEKQEGTGRIPHSHGFQHLAPIRIFRHITVLTEGLLAASTEVSIHEACQI